MPGSIKTVVGVWLIVLCAPVAGLAGIDDPVESGREALGESGNFPWYDAKADDVRPVTVRGAKEVKGSSGSERGRGREGEERERGRSFRVRSPSGFLAGGAIVAWIVVGLIIAALVGTILYAILQGDGLERKGKTAKESAGVDLEALPVPVAAADSDLLAEARRLYERGEFARAMIYLYSHMLLRLDRGHLIRLAKGKTNRQYLREVRSRPTVASFFESAMHAFEAAFFGRRELPRDDFETTWRGIDDFHRSIDEARA
ncbi:MAG: hypothetical protein DCC68_13960 [Planctomycetota bacterium]|nr:MAG: hypothetical protein DCC68_13960 [Planctomycetota bacterium]